MCRGQGTICEIRQELNPDIIISCVGGGGLVSGLISENYYNDDCKIYGGGTKMQIQWHSGEK